MNVTQLLWSVTCHHGRYALPFTLMVEALQTLQATAPPRPLWSEGRKQLERKPKQSRLWEGRG